MFRLFFNHFSKDNSFGQLVRSSRKMYTQSATDLSKLSNEAVKTWLDSFDTVLTDCDGKLIDLVVYIRLHDFLFLLSGVLWMYNNVIDGSPDVINRFKEMGKKVFFVTNNSTKTRSEFLEKAISLNFRMVEVC